jgi:hypothetical protein
MRRHQSVRAAILTIGLLSSPTQAQAELSESPIAPGEIAADKDTLGSQRGHYQSQNASAEMAYNPSIGYVRGAVADLRSWGRLGGLLPAAPTNVSLSWAFFCP